MVRVLSLSSLAKRGKESAQVLCTLPEIHPTANVRAPILHTVHKQESVRATALRDMNGVVSKSL